MYTDARARLHLITTTGQGRGTAQPDADVYEQMRIPHLERFEGLEPGGLAPYFSDLNGAFEAAPCGGGRTGTCYRQTVTRMPIAWNAAGSMEPTTVLGDPRWWCNYQISADFLLEEPAAVELLGMVPSQVGPSVGGYHLRVSSDDGFELYSEDPTEGRVVLASGDADVGEGAWHTMALRMQGARFSAVIDGEDVATVEDTRQVTGNAGLRVGGWHHAQFDDVRITPAGPTPRFLPQEDMTATATTAHGFFSGYTHEAANAIDGRPESLWHSRFGPREPLPQSITVDLGSTQRVQGLTMQPRISGPPNGTITAYNVYASDDGEDFTQIAGGTWGPSRATKIATWEPVRTRHLRLEAVAGVQDLAAIGELNVIGNGPHPADPPVGGGAWPIPRQSR
ncbi:hypothetical protein BH23ACT8_BH23ACT8_12620 [soil metagenome]